MIVDDHIFLMLDEEGEQMKPYDILLENKKKGVKWWTLFDEWWRVNCSNIIWITDWAEWVYYSEGYYQRLDSEDIDDIIMKFLDTIGEQREAKKINIAIRSAQAHNKMRLKDFNQNKEWLNCSNGMVNLKTLEFRDHHPSMFFLYKLNVEYLEQPDDTECIDKIRNIYPTELLKFERFIQTILHHDMTNEVMMFVYGPTRSSKGTMTNLVRDMFKGCMSFASLNSLGDTFGYAPLVGNWVNLDSEMEIGYIEGATQANVKKIVGGDGMVQVNKKGTPQFQYMFDDFYFIDVTNQLPTLPAKDVEAWFSKVWMVNFWCHQTHPDPEVKKGAALEINRWFSELVKLPYNKLMAFSDSFTLDDFIAENSKAWYDSAYPLIHICNNLFEKSADINDRIAVDSVITWCNEVLVGEGYGEMEHTKLKQKVTAQLTKMGITQCSFKKRTYYYPIAVKDEKYKEKEAQQKLFDE